MSMQVKTFTKLFCIKKKQTHTHTPNQTKMQTQTKQYQTDLLLPTIKDKAWRIE